MEDENEEIFSQGEYSEHIVVCLHFKVICLHFLRKCNFSYLFTKGWTRVLAMICTSSTLPGVARLELFYGCLVSI